MQRARPVDGSPPLVVESEPAAPEKAEVVNAKGRVLGHRQVRDASLLHRPLGPQIHAVDRFESGSLTLRPSRAAPPGRLQPSAWPGAEVRTLVNQGPTENRIDLTIAGDGYTDADKDKFFDDARRIVDDLFGKQTFKTYLPLFNVHAVFVPSNESGIGDGRATDTALGLFRHSRLVSCRSRCSKTKSEPPRCWGERRRSHATDRGRGSANYDRNFYDVRLPLSPGRHTIEFRENVADGNNVLSKVNVYSVPTGYPSDPEQVGAFATFNRWGRKVGYRPTDAGCLMRDMAREDFCEVCTENMHQHEFRIA